MKYQETVLREHFRKKSLKLVVICAAFAAAPIFVASAATVPEEITQEATSPNSETNHPLPLMASWSASSWWDTSSTTPNGYSPAWQMQMINQGKHFLPWFNIPSPELAATEPYLSYFSNAIQSAAQQNLPLVFVGTQWEQLLYSDPNYFNLPSDQNPNVIDANMVPQQTVSAFGPIGPWQGIGATWATSPLMQLIQQWYPNPPLVIFISNNEASKQQWTAVEQDQHYIALYGTGQSDEFKREKVAQGWIDRYRALQQAWRNNLSPEWQSAARFIAYEAFGPKAFGRWSGWSSYSLYNTNRIDPSPLTWDGGTPSYYLAFGNPPSDDAVWSPQVEAMNYQFMRQEALTLNPNFWFEISAWNGCDWYPLNTAPTSDSDCARLINTYPNYTPERYAGMMQFLMWLERPRVVRDFRGWAEPRAQSWPYFDVLSQAVERVYSNPTLTKFWRNSQLVANTSRPHPYQGAIPTEYSSANRMYLLTTNLDPAQPWSLSTQLPIQVIARVVGSAPTRQWLLYAFAPNGTTTAQVAIPGYQNVGIDGTPAGAFYLVDESTGTVSSLGSGDIIVNVTNVTNVTPSDIQPPSAPVLTATSNRRKVQLAWSVATDNVAVAGYTVWRSGVSIGSTSGTSYTDSQVVRGATYTYYVMAFDAAGNSTASNIVTVKM